MKVNKMTDFKNGKTNLINLIGFNKEITSSEDEEREVDVVYLDYSKAFDAFGITNLKQTDETQGKLDCEVDLKLAEPFGLKD